MKIDMEKMLLSQNGTGKYAQERFIKDRIIAAKSA